MCIAAPGLNTTLVDVILRNAVRNAALTDARRKVAIPTFSGFRQPTKIGPASRITIDVSALMVLG